MRRLLGMGAGAGVLAALLLACPPAMAASTVNMQFRAEATNGYDVRLQSFEGALVKLDLSRRGSTASYRRLQEFEAQTRKRLEVTFADLGEVDVEFTPTERKTSRDGCVRVVKLKGVFRGRISFTGEDRYAQVDEKSAKGRTTIYEFDGCGRERALPERASRSRRGVKKDTILYTCGKVGGPAFLEARKHGKADPVDVDVELDDYRGEGATRIQLIKSYRAELAPSALIFDEALTSANFVAASPFTGSGRFSEGMFTGDLTVDLPGASDVPLTSASARLEKRKRSFRPVPCEPAPTAFSP